MKLQAEACNFTKKETVHRFFLVNFEKTFKNTFFAEHLWAIASEGIVAGAKLVKIQTDRLFPN